MLDLAPQFPRIAKAVELIAQDSGDPLLGFYGAPGAEGFLERRIRAGAEGLSPDDLENVENFLADLSAEDLELLCIGEQTDAAELGAPQVVGGFLLRAFEGFGHA